MRHGIGGLDRAFAFTAAKIFAAWRARLQTRHPLARSDRVARRARGLGEAVTMHVVIRRSGLTGPADEALQRMRDHIVPLVQGRPGFRGYCAFTTEQGDATYSVGVFEDGGSASETEQRIREWSDSHMNDLMPYEAEVVRGETVFHEVSQPKEQQKDRNKPLFAVIRRYQGLPGQTETMHSVVSEHVLPAIIRAEGFRGFYAFRDEIDPNQAVSFTLFETREDAMGVHEEVVDIMRAQLGELAYQEPQMVIGETAILTTA
ncbi:MAG TPA: antibiotic biosynthesis monooxygenase [Roseomonas sp.]